MKLGLLLVFASLETSALPALPPVKSQTAFTLRFAKYCPMYKCGYNWTLHTPSGTFIQLESQCNLIQQFNWRARYANISLADFQNGKVSLSYLQATLEYVNMLICDTDCTIWGYFKLLRLYLKQRVRLGFGRLDGALCYTGIDENSRYCWWNGLTIVLLFIFGCVTLPIVFILQFFNVFTLKTMLSDGNSGACLYMHLAETFTDFAINLVVICVDCFLMGQAMYNWQNACQNDRLVAFFAFSYDLKRLLRFWNQCFLASLITDRLYAIWKPMKYYHSNQKRRAKWTIVGISVATMTLYLPILLIKVFDPLLRHWKMVDDFWFNLYTYWHTFDTTVLTKTTSMVVLLQIMLSIVFERKYTAFMRNTTVVDDEQRNETRRKEKEKRLLLGGTVGLNLATIAVSLITYYWNSLAWNRSADVVIIGRLWYVNVFWMLEPVLTFVNGSGGLVFHVLLCKSYRKAFMEVIRRMRCGGVQ